MALKNYKIVNEVKVLWRLVAVGNGWLWLTPCKRMKLRRSEWAQLGDCTKEGMSLVEGRLWSKLLMLPRPTVSDAHHFIFWPVSKLRPQASLHGVNHNLPFPTALKSSFSTFSVLSPSACFQCVDNLLLASKHAEGMSLRYDAIFALSDNRISEDWFFAEGERFFPFGDATDLVRGRR